MIRSSSPLLALLALAASAIANGENLNLPSNLTIAGNSSTGSSFTTDRTYTPGDLITFTITGQVAIGVLDGPGSPSQQVNGAGTFTTPNPGDCFTVGDSARPDACVGALLIGNNSLGWFPLVPHNPGNTTTTVSRQAAALNTIFGNITIPAGTQLTLKVNDSFYGDNTGSFTLSACSYSFPFTPPGPVAYPAGGLTGSVLLITQTGCPWTAQSTLSWAPLASGSESGTGQSQVVFVVPANNTGAVRSGNVTIAGVTIGLIQNPTNPPPVTFSCNPSAGPVRVGVAWTSTCTVSGGIGPYTFGFAAPNTLPQGLTASPTSATTSTISGTPTQAGSYSFGVYARDSQPQQSPTVTFSGTIAPACTYSLNPTSANIAAGGGNGSTAITAPSGCAWTAASNASWITVTAGSSGSGNGSIGYTVQATSGGGRSGTITIGGQTFTVNQGDGCPASYSINPTNASVANAGGTGSVAVTAGPGCSWGASSSDAWIAITSGSSGSGNGTVNYSVQPNTGAQRSGTLTVAGKTFTITQGAVECSYSLSASSTLVDKTAAGGSVSVNAGPACAWTASSPDSWIIITSGGSGTGNGVVSFSVNANTGPVRSSTLTIAGQPYVVTQSGSSCEVASLSPGSASVAAASTNGTVTLTMSGSQCAWTAVSNSPWITITSAASGSGNAAINYSVAANSTQAGRTGTLTIAGTTYTVRQAGPDCGGILLGQTTDSIPASGGTRSVSVSAQAGCPYTAISGSSFLAVTGNTGVGAGTVTYSVQPNTSLSLRRGTLTIAGQTYTVSQAADITPFVSCNVTALTSPAVRSTGRTEQLSDLEIACTGRSGGNAYSADILLTLNTNFTNRIVQAASETTDAVLTLNNGGSFAGRVAGSNVLRFSNVPISSGEPNVSVRMQISRLRADASAISPAVISGVVAFRAPIEITVLNPSQTLARPQTAISARRNATADGPGSTQKIVTAQIQEGFAAAFRTRDGEAGDTGTRLRLKLTGIPAGAQVYAPAASSDNKARLMSADDQGAGGSQVSGSPRAGGSYQLIPVNSGTAIATFEIFSTDPASLETLQFPFLVENAASAAVDAVNLSAALAAISSINQASATASIPRFADPSRSPALTNLRVTSAVATGSRVTLNSAITYSYSVFNDSDQPVTGAVLRILLPDGVASANCSAPQGACAVTGPVVRFDLGNMAAGARLNITLQAVASGAAACPNCGSGAIGDSRRQPASLNDGVGGVGSCPNCLGNGSLLSGTATVSANEDDSDLSNNTADSQVEIAATCSFGVSRSLLTASPAGSTLKVDVTTGPTCDWQLPSPGDSFVSIAPSGGSVRGNLTVTLNAFANTTNNPRATTVGIAGTAVRIEQAAQACTPALSAPGVVPALGGSFSLSITLTPACTWTAVASPDWLRITSQASGVGSGSITFTAQANPSQLPRSASLEVNGQLVVVNQPAAAAGGITTCTYSLSASTSNVGPSAATGSVTVTAPAGCTWSATSNASFVTITSGNQGSGSGSVAYAVAANAGSNRSASITIADQVFTVNQSGPSGTPAGLRFVALAPCRVMETRAEYNFQGRTGSFGPPYLRSGETRSLTLANSNVCQIPATAKAYVLNVTLIPRGPADFVTVWPAAEPRPDFWTVRSPDGQIVANSAIVKSGNGAIQVYSSNDTDMIIDIAGYFTDDAAVSNLVYYPLTPCRVIDTRLDYRTPAGPFGPPQMNARETRNFRFPGNPYCTIPAGAAAYSVTITAVPPAALQYLTAWPAGGSQPNVSNINSPAGRVLANSVILPASSDGSISVFTFDRTDFLVDINGYFAPDNGSTGLYYYPVTQCRVSDSRNAAGTFGGPIFGDQSQRTIPVAASGCTGIASSAKAYAMNATAIPNGNPMPFLTLWPTGQDRPNISVLNAFQGQTVTNSAIIPAGVNGSIEAFTYQRTHVVLEISGYFGR